MSIMFRALKKTDLNQVLIQGDRWDKWLIAKTMGKIHWQSETGKGKESILHSMNSLFPHIHFLPREKMGHTGGSWNNWKVNVAV